MAPRKDQMRIIRQDAGFSAKLGFGGVGAGIGVAAWEGSKPGTVAVGQGTIDTHMADAAAGALPDGGVALRGALPDDDLSHPGPQRSPAAAETRKEEEGSSGDGTAPGGGGVVPLTRPSSSRGQVVYVAVSLTARQAVLAETWAEAARCSVQFLIRRVAQALREEACEDWEREGMPTIAEPRGARGKYPTSVTLTLRQGFADALAARHDPLGMMGLARVMGPAFRARFETAFDEALARVNITTALAGEDE